jgi:hypothetical protein
MEVIMTVKIR